LECSGNILEKGNLATALRECNRLVTQLLPTESANCKARAVLHDIYCIGDNLPKAALVHLEARAMPGRSEDILQKLTRELLSFLQTYFEKSAQALDLQITVNVSALEKTYLKYRSS
jgi:5-carboxymethyl-2-hydroxymuconate isomerase